MLKNFEYFEPTKLEDACALLQRYQDDGRILAGGTDLLIKMRSGSIAPKHVISLEKISVLKQFSSFPDGRMSIGACVTIGALEFSPFLISRMRLLHEACSRLGSSQIRNMATLGGNLCNAAPSADCAPPLLVLDASVSIVGPEGERKEPLTKFFVGPGFTSLKADEIVTEIWIPRIDGKWEGTYIKHSRRREMDLATVGVAVLVKVDADKEICTEARIGLGAVGPTPFRAERAERILMGQRPTLDLLGQVSSVASDETRPITDVRASAEYRKHITRVNVRRGLEHCFANLGFQL
jgi:CO/xanthine dehydrogenase FAD-binding subunit